MEATLLPVASNEMVGDDLPDVEDGGYDARSATTLGPAVDQWRLQLPSEPSPVASRGRGGDDRQRCFSMTLGTAALGKPTRLMRTDVY
jgi:hypothetical protein